MSSLRRYGLAIVCSLFILLSVYFAVVAADFAGRGARFTYSIYGPAFFPFLMLALIALFSTILIVKQLTRRGSCGKANGDSGSKRDGAIEPRPVGRALLFWGLCSAYAFGWELLGFLPASILFVVGAAIYAGARLRAGLAALPLIVVALWHLFAQLSVNL